METTGISTAGSDVLGRGQKLQATAGYYLGLMVLGLVVAVLGPTLPALAAQTGSTLGDVSFLFSARSIGGLLGALLAGHVFDRYAGHPILITTLVAIGLALVLIPLMPWLWVLIVVVLLLGTAESALDVGSNTLLVWLHGRKVGPYMNGLHFSFGVGAFLAPIIIAQVLLRSESIRWGYWIMALAVVPIIVYLARTPGPTPITRRSATEERRSDPLMVLFIALFLALYVGAEVGFGGWIFSYAVGLGLAPEAQAAYLTSAFWGAFTVGRLVSIPAAAFFRPRAVLALDLLGALASGGLLLLWPGSLAVAWIGAIGMGLALASVFPTALSLAERRMTISGRVTSWFFVGASLGGMSLPWLMGQLFEGLGPRAIIVALLVDLLLAGAVFLALLWYSRRE